MEKAKTQNGSFMKRESSDYLSESEGEEETLQSNPMANDLLDPDLFMSREVNVRVLTMII